MLLLLFEPSCISSADTRPAGDHPAPTPAATTPAMRAVARTAEFERDRFDPDFAPELGVAKGDPKFSSPVGVCGVCIEFDLECDGLRDRCKMVSLGC